MYARHIYVMKSSRAYESWVEEGGELLLDVFLPLPPLPLHQLLLLQPLLFLMPYQRLSEESCRCRHTWNRSKLFSSSSTGSEHSEKWWEIALVVWQQAQANSWHRPAEPSYRILWNNFITVNKVVLSSALGEFTVNSNNKETIIHTVQGLWSYTYHIYSNEVWISLNFTFKYVGLPYIQVKSA